MKFQKIGLLSFGSILFIIILNGCGGGGISSKSSIKNFNLKRDNSGYVTNIGTTLNFTSSTLKGLQLDPGLTCFVKYSNFRVDNVSCKDKNVTPKSYNSPTLTLTSSNYSGSIDLSIDVNSSSGCKDVKYFTYRYDENSSCKDKYTKSNKNKESYGMVINPDYSDSSLSFYKNKVSYNKISADSNITLTVYEEEYNSTSYANNGNTQIFANRNFKESNATFGDWVLVPDKNISYLINDINESNITGEIVVDKNINKNKMTTSNSINVILALKRCSFDFNGSAIGYNCPESNISKIYVIEYNATDAVYKSIDNL